MEVPYDHICNTPVIIQMQVVSHSTVVLCIGRGWSSIIAIHKEISAFIFSFNLNLPYTDRCIIFLLFLEKLMIISPDNVILC